jgi:hypothetical protein
MGVHCFVYMGLVPDSAPEHHKDVVSKSAPIQAPILASLQFI